MTAVAGNDAPEDSNAAIVDPKGARVAGTLALLLLGLELAFVIVTGGLSFVDLHAKVSPEGFVLREALFTLALFLRTRVLAHTSHRASLGQLMLLLAVLPSLFHLHFAGRRLTGDSLYYFIFTRSMVRDFDVDFANELEHYKLLQREDFANPTDTGHRRIAYSAGPGFSWTPFFIAADGVSGFLESHGIDVNTSGYGPLHLNAVALGSLIYGIGALYVMHALARRDFGDRLAAGAVLFLYWASFLPWYTAEQPIMSHTSSLLLVAAFFLLRERGCLAAPLSAGLMGIVLGLSMTARWQNGVYLLLPAADFLAERPWPFAGLRRVAGRGVALALGVAMGALPQLLNWKAIYGQYLLPYPPQGTDYVRLDRGLVFDTLFSSRHGLLSWTPVFWLCAIGLALLTIRNARRYAILWAPVLIVTWVNSSTADWWAGGAFSNRRFDSLLPILLLGLASCVEATIRFVRKMPAIVPVGFVLGNALWNVTAIRARDGADPRRETSLSLAARTFVSVDEVRNVAGFPTTWPASWRFAWEHGVSPALYDRIVGVYLFHRQNNLGGVADLGSADDDAFRLDGFSSERQDQLITFRSVSGKARIVVGLDKPEALAIAVHARSRTQAAIRMKVNGVEVGEGIAAESWSPIRFVAPQSAWRAARNVVEVETDGELEIDRFEFTRAPHP